MSNYYNADGIKTMLKTELEKARAFSAAWHAVSYNTKKDGASFVNMQKNINGAKYTIKSYAMQDGEYELTVYTEAKLCGYIHDSINCYELVRYLKDDTRKAKTQNYMPKIDYLEQVYRYDIDDIKTAVTARAEYCEKYAAELESMIENCEQVYKQVRALYAAFMNAAKELTASYEHTTLYYAIIDTIKERFPYA